ncbi:MULTISPECIES: DNA polymerase III subunit gamma/tau [Thioalkalivibrio]|uniref:DNA polymerase III subunit gamma/tau n=1 Tax=Thioalkalivibrio halophilus TaxID=252474 RepID=A0A1V3A064_9GAMM|nr:MULTISPECIES: DNA polymerase III subunit gamma/tau [Thioalkalivibrio]OOC10758.1 DNA polymerase III, subunit gamma and tau [Thioalkalivibrio halophilus]
MSHQVLARKWRPARFGDLVGQPHVVRALTNALSGERLHHAYLFAGTRGVGKTTVARILARCLNCETGVTAEPCGQCRSCVEIAEGRHLDLIEVDAASRTRVDDTRELLDNVSYAPTTGRFKVYLIDEVHMLSEKSFNALLKTLEEPPEHVKFLLATTDPQKLPVTVLSRCLQFNLKPMPAPLIAEYLTGVLETEGVTAESGALLRLAEAAEGSMRDALSLTDQAIAYAGEELTEGATCDMLGLLPRTRLTGLLDAVFAGDGAALVHGLAELDTLGPDWSRLLDELAALLHRVAVLQVAGEVADSGEAGLDWVRDAAGREDPELIQLAYQILIHGVRDLPYAPDPRMGVEMTLLRLLAFRPEGAPDTEPGGAPSGGTTAGRSAGTGSSPAAAPVSPSGSGSGSGSAVASRPVPPAEEEEKAGDAAVAPDRDSVPAASRASPRSESGGAAAVREPRAEAKPEPAAGAGAVPPSSEPVGDPDGPAVPAGEFDWHAFAARLPAGTARELALQAEFRSLDTERLTLALPPDYRMLCTERARERLSRSLEAHLGRSVRLEIVDQEEAGGDTPAARLAANAEARQAEAESAMRQDPVVQALHERFGAELGPVRLHDDDPTLNQDPGAAGQENRK